MTWDMPDSITVPDLPNGYQAYLGYADGALIPPTAAALKARFPRAEFVILTTNGTTLDCDGCDIETGDLTPDDGVVWAQRHLKAFPAARPVLYCSVSVMPDVIATLGEVGIKRSQVRLLSAHYDSTAGRHICGPATCRWPGVPPMDGTQWTSVYPGLNGSRVDMSLCEDSFFGLSWTEHLVQQLPEVREGNTGEAVRTVQGNLQARHHAVVVDGVFGPVTLAAVKAVQIGAGVPVDGVVGPQTWPVLLGIT